MPIPHDAAGLHHAGATVRHQSPFANLSVPVSEEALDAGFIAKWVRPFYMADLVHPDELTTKALATAWQEIDESLALRLLSEFNWRPRLVGAYFVALKRMNEHEDLVGRLLLRSDVCDAGRGYCLALARLGTPAGLDYIKRYLDYYLTRTELWFEQSDAMAALAYFDHQNRSDNVSVFLPRWKAFIGDKPNWNLDRTRELFVQRMKGLDRLASRVSI